LELESNRGKLPISSIADVDGFEKSFWFSEDATTNILSLSQVKQEYDVSYNWDDFIIHRAKRRYPDMVFKPHLSGLHVLDVNDSRSQASNSFVETVAENMQLFTKRQIASAQQARDLQAGLGFPSVQDYKWIVKANMLKDCPVISQDVDVALRVWGNQVPMLKDKMVPSQPVFTNQKGLPIGYFAMNSENYDYVEANDHLPGVHLESTQSAEIPGVGSTDQDPSDYVPDLADAFDVNVDFDSQANPQDIVQMNNDSPVPKVEIPLVQLGVGDTLAGGTAGT